MVGNKSVLQGAAESIGAGDEFEVGAIAIVFINEHPKSVQSICKLEMAGIGYQCLRGALPTLYSSSSSKRICTLTRCCTNSTPSKDSNRSTTPPILKFAVSGITEVLRLLSPSNSSVEKANQENEVLVSGVDDVLDIIKLDYEKAYFLTGIFTSAMYADDCLFEDPTIKFRGTELYARNLQLLVPFFEQPSILLQQIEKVGTDSESNFVLAKWQLRTYLKLPWKPLISIDGSTVYDLDDQLKIIRHAESWNVSALEAVAQIFRPNQ
ncbi:hypothetical protein V2J09_007916 [Rumex salicifolius]